MSENSEILSDEDVAKLCMQRYNRIDTDTHEIQDEREKNLEFYNREPFGDEIEGLSDFMTSDVHDVVESILQDAVETFVGDESPGSFRAMNADDAESARIETAYVRHIYNDKNDGFINTYTWIKDCLIQKNGIIAVVWDDRVEETQETYEERTLEQLLALAADDEITIDAVTVTLPDGKELDLEQAQRRFGFKLADVENTEDEQVLEFTKTELPEDEKFTIDELTFDIEATTKRDLSKVRIEPIAPEKFFVDTSHPSISLKEADVCGHWEILKRSDLRTDGISEEIIDDIPHSTISNDTEQSKRFSKEGLQDSAISKTEASETIQVWQFYIRDDLDGSGKVKLWSVMLGGEEGSTLIEREQVDSVPYIAITPNINPHKFYGNCAADVTRDIQVLKSNLWRGTLDNLSLTNNPIKIVNPDKVNVRDLLYTVPGTIVRAKDPINAITNHTTPFVAAASLSVMPMVDEMRHERTGVSPVSQGLDPKAMADSTNTVGTIIMTQALARIKMVVRTIAETGFKEVMEKIHELTQKNVKTSQIFDVGGGVFLNTDPREWKKREGYDIRVGVGHIDKIQRTQAITNIVNEQRTILSTAGTENPWVSPGNYFEALMEWSRLMGYPDSNRFFSDPKDFEPTPEEDPIDELIEVEKAKTVGDIQKQAEKNKLDLQIHKDVMELKRAELEQANQLELAKLDQEATLKREEMLLRYGKDIIQNPQSREVGKDLPG